MSVTWWPSWTKPSVYSIHSSSSDKTFVVIWRLLMWVSLHFCEDHHQSRSDWFSLKRKVWHFHVVTLSVHGSFIYHRYKPFICNKYSMVCSVTCFCLANYLFSDTKVTTSCVNKSKFDNGCQVDNKKIIKLYINKVWQI